MAGGGFSQNWIGGDIGGISALASRLKGYPGQIKGIVDPISRQVDSLVHDAGWWGDAAAGFKQSWKVDAKGAQALGEALASAGSLLEGLATTLGKIEGALEQAADEARAAGVNVGPDGKPPTLPEGATPGAQQAASTYAQEWQVAMDLARRARMDANIQLQSLEGIVGPPDDAGKGLLQPDQYVSVADYLRGFWTFPAGTGREQASKIPGLIAERKAALRQFQQAVRQYQRMGLKTPDDIKAARRDSLAALRDAQSELSYWEKLTQKVPLAKLLDVRMSDLGHLGPVLRGLAGDSEALRSLADIPVVDVVAATVATGFMAYDDMQKGQSAWTAVPEELSANLGGIAAGALVGAGVVAGAAVLGVSAPAVVVVGVGAVVGGAVAVGVGDAISNAWHEHWDEDIHRYGVVGGIGHGLADVGDKTGHDMVNLAEGTGHAIASGASSVWHGIFG